MRLYCGCAHQLLFPSLDHTHLIEQRLELEGWNFEDMVNYFEDDDRKYIPPSPSRSTKARRHLRRVLNQISLEFSATPLAAFVKSPQFVRDVDWIEHMWNTARKEERPRVQYYCLTSTSGCFTDFHVDFGGTSVWYHVLSGKKVFLLVPPTKQNMALYEKWLCRKDQGDIFFPDMRGVMPVEEYDENELDAEGVNGEEEQVGVEDCVRITLVKGQTFIIPTGWIHAVYTPVDSLVLGGNFLHGFDVKGQLDVHCLETRTRVPAKFRFPSFVQLCFYVSMYVLLLHYCCCPYLFNDDIHFQTPQAGAEYFKRLKNPAKYGKIWKEELNGINHLVNALRSWNVGPGGDANRYGSVAYVESQIVQDLGILYGIVDMDEMLKGVEDGVTLKRNGLMDGVSKRGGVSVDRCQSPKGPTIKLSLLKRKASNLLIPSEQSSAAETISSPKPKIKLKLGGIMTVAQNVKLHYANNNDDEFPEMKISSSSCKVGNGRTATADLVSMQNRVVGDDEWLPDVTELTVMGTTSTYIQKSKNSPKQKALKKKWVPKEKPRGNSRSRLMKKFKF